MNIIELIKDAIHIKEFYFINFIHMAIRGIFVYFIGVSIARYNKKLIGIRTPFNFILFIILGSIFANAIVDGSLFLYIILVVLSVMGLNYFMKKLAFHNKWIERFIKGRSIILVKNGKINWNEMEHHLITKRELLNEFGTQAHTFDIEKVEKAILESDGSIDFIFKK